MEYILQMSKLTMALKSIRREGESKFVVKRIETEEERNQLTKIFREAGMKKVKLEPSEKCIEFIAVDKETKRVIGGSVSIIENHKNAEILTAVSLLHRRQGVGSALLRKNEEELRRMGVERAVILPLTAGAYEFLRKQGYHYVGDVEQRVEGFVVAYMEKQLNSPHRHHIFKLAKQS
ncbi:MAG: GNAT family N-acetyltransferase [Candidatus Micrarchaeia archaeon]